MGCKIMALETKLVSSLTKVYSDLINGNAISSIAALKNEPFSFQIAFKNSDDDKWNSSFFIKIESDLDIKYITQYKVGFVPAVSAAPRNNDEFYDRTTPGMYPDLLYKRNNVSVVENDGFWEPKLYEQNEKHQLISIVGSYQSLWFTVNENGEDLNSGDYKFDVVFCSCVSGNELARESLSFKIINYKLPKQELLYTSWFHCDCLADLYNVEVFSDRHFEIIKSFVTEAAKTGMNMILLPAFTPPLDTPVGKERLTVQLVKVIKENGSYIFDFSLMKRFIELCLDCGITHFEHCHLFTQWGARSAPKIMGYENGELKQIFGWDTDSKSDEYRKFLKSYLRALLTFFKEIGLEKENIFFHISDEPMEKHLDYYKNALEVVKDEINGYPSGDALSHYKFYEDGSVSIPIVGVESKEMDKFIENCDNFWVYYTGETLHSGLPNRILSTTGARNRILGIQMYYTGAKGFLHWGYNYYYDVLSHGIFNPVQNPSGYNATPGTSFIVYADTDGTAIPSTRMKVFYEAINDYRALKALEKLIGREEVEKIIIGHFGEMNYRICPDNDNLLSFRAKINERFITETN